MDILSLLQGASVYKINIICLDCFHSVFHVPKCLWKSLNGTFWETGDFLPPPQTSSGKYENGKPKVQLSVGFVGCLWILRGGN